ncbi:unnamed protein product [Schistosoma curassoni]|uniref:Uncharacterized protein n=1 Tax=Schistosoma curassoni TaxID=6186 RepID=A0A183JGK5_9TREM|nr:unnamed protein product [Schistosoma curassoni]
MGQKPGELRKPSSRKYRCLLTIVYTKYFGCSSQTLLATTYCGREQTRSQRTEKEIRNQCWECIGHTLRKAPNYVTKQGPTWNPQGQRRRGRPMNTLHREMETDIRRMNRNWIELGRKT